VAWLRLRAEVRRRWSSWLLIAVLAALVWGVALVALTGARRTETAYDRFLTATDRFDVLVTNGSTPDQFNRQFDFDEVARLPEVADSALIGYYLPSGRTPSGEPLSSSSITPFAATDGRFGYDLNRAKVLHGRMPTGEREMAVSFAAADRFGLRVGDTLPLTLGGVDSINAPPGHVKPTGFRVVGIVAIQGGFPPLTGASIPPMVLLPQAYGRTHPGPAQGLVVRLRRGRADVPAFSRELEQMAKGTQVVDLLERDLTTTVERGVSVQATVLRLLAGVLAAIALVITTQALSRQAFFEATDDEVLRALGMTRGQRRRLSQSRTALVAAGTAVGATFVAIALSPLTPVGISRRAEPHPGLAVNVAALAVGAVAIAVATLVVGFVASRWAIRSARRSSATRPSRVVDALARSGAPPTVVSGVRMALEPGPGSTTVPVRSTIVGGAIGIGALVGVLVFTGSIGRLFDHPVLYGWNWDVQVGSSFSPDLTGDARKLAKDPAVADVAIAGEARLGIRTLSVDSIGIDPLGGRIRPTVVAGRSPQRADEILLGTRTLRALHRDIGDLVPVAFAGRTVKLRIVGRGVLSESAGGERLGGGAALTLDGIRRLVPDIPTNLVLIRETPGGDHDAFIAKLRAAYVFEGVYEPEAPSDLADLESIRGVPFAVAGLLGVVALATLGNALATSVRRRRRDLSVLKVLGFVRGQVATTAAWQAAAFVVLAGLVGVPLGVVAGRSAWAVFADRLGVTPQAVVPFAALAVLGLILLVLSVLIAAVPGRLAARTRPTVGLRAE